LELEGKQEWRGGVYRVSWGMGVHERRWVKRWWRMKEGGVRNMALFYSASFCFVPQLVGWLVGWLVG